MRIYAYQYILMMTNPKYERLTLLLDPVLSGRLTKHLKDNPTVDQQKLLRRALEVYLDCGEVSYILAHQTNYDWEDEMEPSLGDAFVPYQTAYTMRKENE